MPDYDATRFDPPAPLADVSIRNSQTGAVLSDVPMLMDTGADVSLIPLSYIQQLGLALISDSAYELMGFDGTTSLAPVVQTDLLFLNRTFRGRFLVIDQEWGILGRDVLNSVSLWLDGPRLTWSERAPRPTA